MIQWVGLFGLVALLSYAAAVVSSPLAYPGYEWMRQAVSDLSAANAPSLTLWIQLSCMYGIVERFSVFAAVGFFTVLGVYVFLGTSLERTERKMA